MKKKSFALSWGRKMFFGLGWALTSLMALNYFQSMIIPQTGIGWAYFLTTFIGHYGAILAAVYFVAYVPVLSVLPSYYVARIWSIVLILAVNLLIFFDSYIFARYRFHANSFLWKLIDEPGSFQLFGFTPLVISITVVMLLVAFVVLWTRGEKLWRSMQARFSNPVSNWYLVVIALCLGASHLMYKNGVSNGSSSVTRISTLFPLHVAFLQDKAAETSMTAQANQGYKDMYYPAEEMICPIKNPKNVVMIVLDKWNVSDFNELSSPYLFHLASHGQFFKNHFSGGVNKQDGYFSLFYSLPPNYASSVINQSIESVFLKQMDKVKMDRSFYQSGDSSPINVFRPNEKEFSLDYLDSALITRKEAASENPFFTQIYVGNRGIAEKDKIVSDVMDIFLRHKLISNTIFIVTGTHADQGRIPLIVIWPGQERKEVIKLTSHFDVLTTVMIENWKCKNPVSHYSLGTSLLSSDEVDVQVAGTYQQMEIFDTKNQTVTMIDGHLEMEVKDLMTGQSANEKRNTSAILSMLEKLTTFYKRN